MIIAPLVSEYLKRTNFRTKGASKIPQGAHQENSMTTGQNTENLNLVGSENFLLLLVHAKITDGNVMFLGMILVATVLSVTGRITAPTIRRNTLVNPFSQGFIRNCHLPRRKSNHLDHCRYFSILQSTNSLDSSIAASDDTDKENVESIIAEESKTSPLSAKDKRRKFIGLAKAVDRGQWAATYSPGGLDGKSFVSKSGLPDRTKPFLVLGIESSCDDTGAAVIRSDGNILGESIASQNEIHEQWGGIVPGLAKNAHEEKIDGVIATALREAKVKIEDVDAIGVTVGPGLEICLRVGCNRARELAVKHGKPFVGVHHLEAHILMARIPPNILGQKNISPSPVKKTNSCDNRAMEFPFLALLVSGGHCQILKCLGIGKYSIIGGTLDDSLGEAFDKTARLLGLPVGGGGGPAVEALAKDGDPTSISLPIPLQKRKDCDFSYAGLKTAVRLSAEKLCEERNVESAGELPYHDRANIAASFQNVAFRHIEIRLGRAMDQMEADGIKTLAVVGGVAANEELRLRLNALCSSRPDPWEMFVPPPRLCTDQGTMSAWAAVERLMVGSSDSAEDQEVFARYPFSQIL